MDFQGMVVAAAFFLGVFFIFSNVLKAKKPYIKVGGKWVPVVSRKADGDGDLMKVSTRPEKKGGARGKHRVPRRDIKWR